MQGYFLAGCGVDEFEGFGVEHKSFGGGAVDVVADDRCAKSVGVCRMDSHLMGATRDGVEADACAAILYALNLINSMCRTAILRHHLARTMLIVELLR